jgi:cytochrome c-type biogenesis protein
MSFAAVASHGPLVLAVGAAAAAGLVSFLSPCVLPLVPGYVSYVTGLAGADLDAALGTDPSGNPVPARPAVTAASGSGTTAVLERSPAARTTAVGTSASRVRGRIVAGSLLFIAGFTAVFTLTSVAAASAGRSLLVHRRGVEVVVGLLIIVLGLAYAGLVPGLRREFRIRRLPAAGLAGAPVLGAVFALSWVPCVGPTLAAVLAMSATGGESGRAAVLAVAYCLGLGVPFLAFGLGFRRLLGVFAAVRRHSRWVTRIGGALLMLIGVALATGGWASFVIWLRDTLGVGGLSI